MKEMAYNGCRELLKRRVIASKVWVGVGYSRQAHESTAAGIRLAGATARSSVIAPAVLKAFGQAALRDIPIRRLALSFGGVCSEDSEGYDLFTDPESIDKEHAADRAMLDITEKYGKNALLRGVSYTEGATQRERNEMIGGHRAGYDDPRAESETLHAL